MNGAKGFPRTVISTLISQVITKLNTGLNLLVGGTAVSSSNPLPVSSRPDNKTSNSQAALDGMLSKCWVTCPPTATKYPSVQVWNPTGSEIKILVIGMNGYNSSTTMKWFQFLDATKLSTLSGYQQNMKFGEASSPYEMYYQALDAKTATNAVGINVTATTPQGQSLQMAGENICIPANSGLRFEGETAGIGMTIICTLITSPDA